MACEPWPGKINATGLDGAGLDTPACNAAAAATAGGEEAEALAAAAALFSARAFFFSFRSLISQFRLTSSVKTQIS